jgi:hypothetical protein
MIVFLKNGLLISNYLLDNTSQIFILYLFISRYKYLVMNEWILDENEPQFSDEDGNINNIVIIN